MFVIGCLLCAEWLHSSVHGCPGESPRGGTVPSGEQRQSEYGHWGTVHISVFVLSHVYGRSCVRPSHLYSLSPCYCIRCTNHLHLLHSSASFLLLSSRPYSLHIPVCFPSLLFSVSHSAFVCPISFLRPPPPARLPPFSSSPPPSPSPSLHEGLGRASLIGSVWWRGQSDLEWVTDEVRSARCLSLHGCCLCYCPDLRYSACGTHTHKYLPVTTRRQTHQHVHVRRWIADWANGTPRRLYSQLVYIYGQDVHTHGIFWHVCTCAKKQILHSC